MRHLVPALAAALFSPCVLAAQDLYDVDTIRTIHVTAPPDWRTVMANNYLSRTNIRVDVTIDNVLYRDVGARHRGFSTYRFLPTNRTDKRPWKLSFDEFVPGQAVQGYNTLNICNNLWDPSFIREVAGYEFMRKFLPAPKCCYVKLVVNGEDLGLFTNTQQINKDFLEEWYPEDEGNRYRGERTGTSVPYSNTALTWLGSNPSSYYTAYELKTENGRYPPWVDLVRAIDVLNNTPSAQLPAALPRVLDVDNALRFIAVANLTAWLDSYLGRTCKNFYIYEDRFHGRLTFQPWDVNNGFGGLTDGLTEAGVARIDPFFREVDAANPRPLFSKIVQRPEWRARYLAHYRTMLPEFSWSRMGPRIDALRTQIRPLLQADPLAIYTMQQFDLNMTQAINVGIVTVPAITPFFQNRNAFLAAHAEIRKVAPTLTNLLHAPAAPTPQQSVTVTATVSGAVAQDVTLYYRVRGPFAEARMYDDGNHGDGAANDGVFGASIPPHGSLQVVQYYAGANGSLTTGAMSFVPPLAEFRPAWYRVGGAPPVGPLVISEFVAKNDSGIRDEANELEDWIELANLGTQPVDASGKFLTDDVDNPTKWRIPDGTVLQPGQTLLVWADEDLAQGPLHANFKISNSGEQLALYDGDGVTNLDWIEFGAQASDVATGRVAEQFALDFTFRLPSPRRLNLPAPCGHCAYGPALPLRAHFVLDGSGTPARGQNADFLIGGAPPSSPGAIVLAAAPFAMDLGSMGPLLVDLAAIATVSFATDAFGAGELQLPIPNLPQLGGSAIYTQALVAGPLGGSLSNGVATRICP